MSPQRPPRLLLLHGFTGGPSSFDALRARLPEGWASWAPVLAGHRGAPRATGWDDEVERLWGGLAAAPGDGPWTLVGYSMGGRLGWSLLGRATLAGEAPRFERAVLIGAHPGLGALSDRAAGDPTGRAEVNERRDTRRARDAELAGVLSQDGLLTFTERWEALPMWASQRGLDDAVVEARRALRRSHDAEGLAGALTRLGLAEMPTTPLTRIPTPVELVTGALDERHTAIATAAAESLRAAGTPVGHTIVDGAGHDVLLERPDVIAELLLAAEGAS